jgi:3-deoxy-manno-octulosonate cytidylyltransferase (CMP-KDO synthetase)
MDENDIVIVIPARLASTRLPKKLLLSESGKPVIQHTYEAACKSTLATQVIVATDHQDIFEVVHGFGGRVMMTDPNANSGTDRVAEVASKEPKPHLFINVQGDEPEIDAASIDQLITTMQSNSSADVATLATPIRSEEKLNNPNCVKVVCDHEGIALYFSRSPIPFARQWDASLLEENPPLFLQHLGVYGYRRTFLERLPLLKPSSLEQTEKLEQLRFLQNGYRCAVSIVQHAAAGIDTREDYDAFLKRMET